MDNTAWTIVGKTVRGRYFRPIDGATPGDWAHAMEEAKSLASVRSELLIYATPAQGQVPADNEDADNIMLDSGRRVAIRWDATPAASMPLPPALEDRADAELAEDYPLGIIDVDVPCAACGSPAAQPCMEACSGWSLRAKRAEALETRRQAYLARQGAETSMPVDLGVFHGPLAAQGAAPWPLNGATRPIARVSITQAPMGPLEELERVVQFAHGTREGWTLVARVIGVRHGEARVEVSDRRTMFSCPESGTLTCSSVGEALAVAAAWSRSQSLGAQLRLGFADLQREASAWLGYMVSDVSL